MTPLRKRFLDGSIPAIIYFSREFLLPLMPSDGTRTIDRFKDRIAAFIDERDWGRFHRPKDVAAALSIEASELQELYLWDRTPSREDLEDEIADVLFFLIDLAAREGIDISDAFDRKMEKNEERYPAGKVRGSDKKYDSYE
ncbi:MAG: nucleotide pyrophosphohydrolase [Candidatus Thermoplasmatota archaeon]|nr:nucleotide pyrophosphohydrolase [Candidatus Thermoplasmatota archaeon]